jgi:hypothetical protein
MFQDSQVKNGDQIPLCQIASSWTNKFRMSSVCIVSVLVWTQVVHRGVSNNSRQTYLGSTQLITEKRGAV